MYDRQNNVEKMLSAEDACMRLSFVDAIGSIYCFVARNDVINQRLTPSSWHCSLKHL